MNITRIAIQRPVTILMVIGALVISGMISFMRMPVRRLPNVNFPYIRATIAYPGASPADVASQVIDPMEQALLTVNGVVQMTAVASPGRGTVALLMQTGTETSIAAVDVNQALARASHAFPPTALPPVVTAANPSALPIMNIALAGPLTQTQLYNLAVNTVAPALDQVAGVAAVNVVGGLQSQVNVLVDPTAMAEYHVSLSQVMAALTTGNRSTPAGTVVQNGSTYLVRTSGTFQSVAQVSQAVVARRGGGDVQVGDVAQVTMGFAPRGSAAELDGRPAVGLVLTAQSTANSLSVNNAVHASLAGLVPQLPPGVSFAVIGNITRFTRASLNDVEVDLALAVLITGIVLMLFLHRVQNTLIVMLAIPTSLIMTFTVMYALHFSLDLISLMALSLLIGILVDDAIVVLENIHRHVSLGEAVRTAAFNGRMEIGAAAVAITLTDVVVYGPTAFVTGNVGQLFREFGLTVTAATLISLVISFTLTPMLASRWLRAAVPAHEPAPAGGWSERFAAAWERGYARVVAAYRRAVRAALRHRGLVLLVAFGALVFSAAAVPLGLVGTTFTPQEDTGTFTVQAQFPPTVTLATSQQDIHALAAEIQHLPGVVNVYDSAGFAGGLGSGTGFGQVTVDLAPKGERPGLFTYYRPLVLRLARTFAGMTAHVAVQNPLVLPGNRALQVQITGPSLPTLENLSQLVAARMAKLPDVTNVGTNAAQNALQLSLVLDRAAADYLGVTSASVGAAVAQAVQGKVVTSLQPSPAVPGVPVYVQMAGAALSARELQNLPVPTAHGMVPLGQVVQVQTTSAPQRLQFVSRQLAVTVAASVTSSDLGRVTAEAQAMMRTVALPPGYTFSIGGQAAQQKASFGPLAAAFGLSILLIYMLMAALYESLLYPLVLILTLPLATVGALLGLMLTGQTLNVFSFIGLIMLVGLVAKNAILLIDYTNTLRERGMAVGEALVEAGAVRLRPIVMTTATMVFAMLPLALSNGAGAEDRQPMAVVVIGGVLTSTLLTLVVVPVMYSLMTQFMDWLATVRGARRGAAGLPIPWAGPAA